jgi:excisionase family DNA binding protein
LSTREAAAALGVHERTLRRYVSSGLLGCRRLPGGRYRIPEEAIHEFCVAGDASHIVEVLSWNQLDEWGKTEHATGRAPKVPTLLREDLAWWRARLHDRGYPTRGVDFIIPGDLAGEGFGIRDPQTGACHMSGNQAQKWGPRYLTPAVNSVAENHDGYASLRGATPYALRRGGISMRLRSEDAQSVAEQCGTSLEMLSQHYSYEIDDFSHLGPRSVDEQWRSARAAVRAALEEDAGSRRLRAVA